MLQKENVEEINIFVPPEIDDVDPKDIRSVVSSVSASMDVIANNQKNNAIRMFKIGCMLVKGDKEDEEMPSLREIGKYVGVNFRNLSIAKTMARRYDCDVDTFVKEYERVGASSWTTMANKVLRNKRKYISKSVGNKTFKKITDLIVRYNNGEMNKEEAEELLLLRDKIVKHLPANRKLFTEEGIRYSMCGCCGNDDIPPEGWEIVVHEDFHYIEYPICPECSKRNAKPSWEILAKIYALHNSRMQEFYEEINSIYEY